MLFFLTWITLSFAVGMFASERRNRNPFGWFILAFIISPVIAGVFVAILNEKSTQIIRPVPRLDELPASEQIRLARLRQDLATS